MLLLACLSLSAADMIWQPRPEDSLVRLANFLREQSTDVLEAQVLADAQEGQLAWTHVYPNPNLHLRVANIPVGATNPAGLRPGDQVMSYGFALDYKIELNKRGYRQDQARWLYNARKAHVAAVLRERSLALGRVLGKAAVIQLVQKAVKDALSVAKAGGSDNDKLAFMALQLEQRSLELDADLQKTLGECSAIVAIKCNPFVSPEDARGFFDRWVGSVPAGDDTIDKNWPLRVLEAEQKAALAAKSLHNQGIIPDPTLYFGYTHDRLTIGGNQPNTFVVGLSIPISFFDRGQAQAAAAENMAKRLDLQQKRALEASREVVRALRATQTVQQKRLTFIEKDLVPRAEKLWDAAAKSGGDLGFAERMLAETTAAHGEALGRVFETAVLLLLELPEVQ